MMSPALPMPLGSNPGHTAPLAMSIRKGSAMTSPDSSHPFRLFHLFRPLFTLDSGDVIHSHSDRILLANSKLKG